MNSYNSINDGYDVKERDIKDTSLVQSANESQVGLGNAQSWRIKRNKICSLLTPKRLNIFLFSNALIS